MNHAFATLMGPIFRHVINFQDRLGRGEDPELGPERDRLRDLLERAGRRAAASPSLAADFGLARHALVYWIDEIAIMSGWGRAAEWKERILEFEIFGTWVGGERFFEEARRAEARAGTDPLETFFLCVALGFRGRYAGDGPGLRAWAERVHARIVAGGSPDRPFPGGSEDDPAPLRPLRGESALLASSVLVATTVLATLGGFLLLAQAFSP
jgi:type VI secretion system protein ImpK